MDLHIEPEQPGDQAAIHDLTRRAFAGRPYAAGDEQELVDALRAVGALALSLVARLDGQIVGHLALSPATHESGAAGWYTLGPISAAPALQRQGIGAALMATARSWLEAQGAAGCILTGDPRYYSRHGYVPAPDHCPPGEPAQYFQLLPLRGPAPTGRFRFHPVFSAGHPAN